jgi:hypothetical protein
MAESILTPPAEDEYADFYAGYITRVGGTHIHALLTEQPAALMALMRGISPAGENARYAEGKWSLKEVVGHVADSERIFACRALRIARGDPTPLPGFDQDLFVANAAFDRRALGDLISEFADVRRATLALVGSLTAVELERRGNANGLVISVRALVYTVAGHAEHHLEVLRDRYGLGRAADAAP